MPSWEARSAVFKCAMLHRPIQCSVQCGSINAGVWMRQEQNTCQPGLMLFNPWLYFSHAFPTLETLKFGIWSDLPKNASHHGTNLILVMETNGFHWIHWFIEKLCVRESFSKSRMKGKCNSTLKPFRQPFPLIWWFSTKPSKIAVFDMKKITFLRRIVENKPNNIPEHLPTKC